MFSIRFLSTSEIREKGLVSHWTEPSQGAFGEIVLGNFREAFLSSLSYWERGKYLSHWRRSLADLTTSWKSVHLITSIDLPGLGKAATIWQIYVFSERLIFQNHLVFPDFIKYPVTESHTGIPELEYKKIGDDGEAVSEWEVQKEDVSLFLEETIFPSI